MAGCACALSLMYCRYSSVAAVQSLLSLLDGFLFLINRGLILRCFFIPGFGP